MSFIKQQVVILLIVCVIVELKGAQSRPKLILVSFDGFRSSSFDQYLKENPSSNFHRIINVGVKAEFMKASFPTSTFPNHWTLVTGLYPESHGF